MGNEFGKGKVGKGNNAGGGSGLPRHDVIEERLCLTVPEVAKKLGLSRNFTYELVKRGELPSTRFGKRIVISKIALEKMLEKGVQNGM